MNEQQKKIIKAKLYNLRSGIDGMVPMVEGDVFSMQAFDNAMACLFNSFLKSVADVTQDEA